MWEKGEWVVWFRVECQMLTIKYEKKNAYGGKFLFCKYHSKNWVRQESKWICSLKNGNSLEFL